VLIRRGRNLIGHFSILLRCHGFGAIFKGYNQACLPVIRWFVSKRKSTDALVWAFLAACGAACVTVASVAPAYAFPLWPKGKDQPKEEKPDKAQEKQQAKSKDKSKDQPKAAAPAVRPAGGAGPEAPARPDAPARPRHTPPAILKPGPNVFDPTEAVPQSIPHVTVPFELVPPSDTSGNPRAGVISKDPMAIYRSAGVSTAGERKIRQLAQEFDGMQRVRLKLMANLLGELRDFEFQTDPDPKKVLDKQAEVNKLTALMANERVKLIIAIRDVMSHDEKVKLVELLQRANGINPPPVVSAEEAMMNADKASTPTSTSTSTQSGTTPQN